MASRKLGAQKYIMPMCTISRNIGPRPTGGPVDLLSER
ncbi:hypothetical protein FOQG_07468 [Fusarium oxysporum f. sp. raphani 54005]|uniref:Uncharacterized protein n=5 Tax=Fusarium oxysporum TaxID=5507 RepID=W9IM84_FUSOX|nr:hypothetical protein FOYG_07156 [Fusarium oxysporum NRRL 32931]EXA53494.1 hypothetical protein FOVG_01305 [Fusarium oxysporum f. sp. pisi HDV247]EXK90065.1 hypothetical protein FOQG_07468 [Fusarium oxysporum f. sp. raphani 54005]EXL83712.1 hypothetical protein FOPG_03778 [Fusarium oxysporum f. sp. conglutinans race 2 54008]EXM28410.1 hypothetical protein FOTG_05718 [Fusarium oxysporum f. sp. vasinfectum 25433]